MAKELLPGRFVWQERLLNKKLLIKEEVE